MDLLHVLQKIAQSMFFLLKKRVKLLWFLPALVISDSALHWQQPFHKAFIHSMHIAGM